MNIKRNICVFAAAMCCLMATTGCGKSSAAVSADLSYTQRDMSLISVSPDVQVVGLGEASHGVGEYQKMKAEVFKALVENNHCRYFIIEGDFGGALKVNEYIHGKEGSAKEAVGKIGFAIYRTKEMEDLVEWMRMYNERAAEEDKLYFYGMDVQRFDNNKEILFSLLDEALPELSKKYMEALRELTDENRLTLDNKTFIEGKKVVSELLQEMDGLEKDMVESFGRSSFDFARECAASIYAYCDIQTSDTYNATRDRYMFDKIKWFLEHGDGGVLFINGHNGHIQKTSVAGYTCLGEWLAKYLDKAYYAIGTDAQMTAFNSQNAHGFDVVEVGNRNELNGQLESAKENPYFVDFSKASADTVWNNILSSEQTVTTLNVSLSAIQKIMKSAYTTKIVPNESYNAMIVFHTVSPTTLIE